MEGSRYSSTTSCSLSVRTLKDSTKPFSSSGILLVFSVEKRFEQALTAAHLALD